MQQREAILNAHRQGATQKAIMQQLGLTRGAVRSVIYRARKSGELAPHTTSAQQRVIYARDGKKCLKHGLIAFALRPHDAAFADWLIAQTPEGSTLADTLVAIALDTYLEEQ